MENQQDSIKWATDYLSAHNYILIDSPEVVLETPWSKVFRITTTNGILYLKQPAPAVAREAAILNLMRNQFHAKVPAVLASNDEYHCFLMPDAGQKLRAYLKANTDTDLICSAIRQFTMIQRSIEHNIQPFFSLGVLDWRLDKLPQLYNHLINQTTFLKSEGMSDSELQHLHDIGPQIIQEFARLSEYNIPETIVQPDCNTNNMLIDTNTNELTFIDFGEIVISHPFFSLHNFLFQLSLHEGISLNDTRYNVIQEECLANWYNVTTKEELADAFHLSKKLWPIYSAIVFYHFVHHIVDIHAFRSFYSKNPFRIAECFRNYIGK